MLISVFVMPSPAFAVLVSASTNNLGTVQSTQTYGSPSTPWLYTAATGNYITAVSFTNMRWSRGNTVTFKDQAGTWLWGYNTSGQQAGGSLGASQYISMPAGVTKLYIHFEAAPWATGYAEFDNLTLTLAADIADQTTAQSASTNAGNAYSAANSANTNAAAAKTSADAAKTSADTAGITAAAAKTSADTASARALSALNELQNATYGVSALKTALNNLQSQIAPIVKSVKGSNMQTCTTTGSIPIITEISGASTWRYRVDGSAWSGNIAAATTTATVAVSGNGAHTIEVQATNAGGASATGQMTCWKL